MDIHIFGYFCVFLVGNEKLIDKVFKESLNTPLRKLFLNRLNLLIRIKKEFKKSHNF